jgi:sulfoxide reductase heme-binding subunit YedZ
MTPIQEVFKMAQFITSLPLWQMIRFLGIASYVLLTVGICLGITYSFPVWTGKQKATVYKLHTWAANGGTALGLLHGAITVIDTYMPFSWSEVLLPFTATHAPILNGFGSLSGYGMLIVIFTSDIRSKLKKKVWHLIHLLSYPIFVLSFAHGYFLGTDTNLVGIRWMYLLSILAVAMLTAARFLIPASASKGSAAGQRLQ